MLLFHNLKLCKVIAQLQLLHGFHFFKKKIFLLFSAQASTVRFAPFYKNCLEIEKPKSFLAALKIHTCPVKKQRGTARGHLLPEEQWKNSRRKKKKRLRKKKNKLLLLSSFSGDKKQQQRFPCQAAGSRPALSSGSRLEPPASGPTAPGPASAPRTPRSPPGGPGRYLRSAPLPPPPPVPAGGHPCTFRRRGPPRGGTEGGSSRAG